MRRAFVLALALLSFYMTACAVLEDYSRGSSEKEVYSSTLSPDGEVDKLDLVEENLNGGEGLSQDELKTESVAEKETQIKPEKKEEVKSEEASKPSEKEEKKSKKDEYGKKDDKPDKSDEEVKSDKSDKSNTTYNSDEKPDKDKDTKKPKLDEKKTGKTEDLFESPSKGSYKNLSNEKRSWYYKPKKNFSAKKSSIPDEVAVLMDRYGALWQVDTGENKMYLTFDEGYEYENNTEQILDTLKEKGVKAAFFVTGAYVKSRPELVKRMNDEGHLVCSHSVNHLNQVEAMKKPEKLEADVLGLEAIMQELVGFKPATYFRPPEGVYSEATLSFLREHGYTPVFWSFAYKDWLTDKQPSNEAAIEKITGQFHSGSIILLHAVSKTNVSVLGTVIDKAIEAGYRFGDLSDL